MRSLKRRVLAGSARAVFAACLGGALLATAAVGCQQSECDSIDQQEDCESQNGCRWFEATCGGETVRTSCLPEDDPDPSYTCDADVGPKDGGVDADGPDGSDSSSISCTPGETLSCRRENTQQIWKCNEAGDARTMASCPTKSVCRDGECVDVTCVPGRGQCTEDGVPQECNEEGTGYVDREPCEEGEICESGNCLNRCENAATQNSYIGCEYWAVELENHLLYEERETGDPIPDDQLPPFAVVIGNPRDYDAEVTIWAGPDEPATAIGSREVSTDIRRPGTTLRTVHSELVDQEGNRLLGPIDDKLVDVPVPSNSMLTVMLPNHQIPDDATSIRESAYRIESTQPVVAYQFNPYCCNYNYTNDASLLLPTSAMTGNYRYMSYPVWDSPQRGEGDSPESPTISLMATEEDTQVDIQLPESSMDASFEELLHAVSDPGRVTGPNAEGEMQVTLQPHEIFNVESDEVPYDFTGARVDADAPISIFGSHSCTFVPFSTFACDHLESQLFPMETWGRTFHATPLKFRGDREEFSREGTYWKFVAQKADTRIETGLNLVTGPDGVLPQAGEGVPFCGDEEFSPAPEEGIIELDAGETCEFGTKETFVARASKPVLLGAFLSGQNTVGENVSKAGDPSFFLVPPEQQYRNDYSFLSPQTYFVDYVTVTVPATLEELTLDGETIDLTTLETYRRFDDLGVARAHIEVEDGPHRIRSEANAFGAVVYGYDDFVSYAYTGGLDLAKRNDVE